MSLRYQRSEDVPNGVLAARLDYLAGKVGIIDFGRLEMRVPAEVDQDADLVMAEAARRLRKIGDEP